MLHRLFLYTHAHSHILRAVCAESELWPVVETELKVFFSSVALTGHLLAPIDLAEQWIVRCPLRKVVCYIHEFDPPSCHRFGGGFAVVSAAQRRASSYPAVIALVANARVERRSAIPGPPHRRRSSASFPGVPHRGCPAPGRVRLASNNLLYRDYAMLNGIHDIPQRQISGEATRIKADQDIADVSRPLLLSPLTLHRRSNSID